MVQPWHRFFRTRRKKRNTIKKQGKQENTKKDKARSMHNDPAEGQKKKACTHAQRELQLRSLQQLRQLLQQLSLSFLLCETLVSSSSTMPGNRQQSTSHHSSDPMRLSASSWRSSRDYVQRTWLVYTAPWRPNITGKGISYPLLWELLGVYAPEALWFPVGGFLSIGYFSQTQIPIKDRLPLVLLFHIVISMYVGKHEESKRIKKLSRAGKLESLG